MYNDWYECKIKLNMNSENDSHAIHLTALWEVYLTAIYNLNV